MVLRTCMETLRENQTSNVTKVGGREHRNSGQLVYKIFEEWGGLLVSSTMHGLCTKIILESGGCLIMYNSLVFTMHGEAKQTNFLQHEFLMSTFD